jgi:tRNA nucleotidyltransferase (CCA-adding enzyme)
MEGGHENYIDPYSGLGDIEKKIIKTVGKPDERFSEDALRLLRAIRLATQLNFKIDDETWEAIVKNANLITNISWERIRDELLKILSNEKAYDGVILLDQSGILDIIFPELAKGKGISQARPGRHHTTDVFTHNVESLHHTPATDPIVRLATLLHDVGKPYVQGQDEEGHVIFYNHEVAGAKAAAEIADRLRLSKKQKDKVVTLIRWHMFTVDEHITDSAIRRFIRRVGLENVADMMDLRIGDRLGGGTQVAESWRLKKFKERVASELNPPFSINDLAIDGDDIMNELKIKPGPKIGEILNALFLEVDENLELNNQEYLTRRIHELGKE